jgi:peptide-methionine (S)-S-oxide reductase
MNDGGLEAAMTERATFGAGCFWGVETAFRETPGVTDTAVGYLGGTLEDPSYEDVCTGRTGHAEVVQVEFDPERVSYEELLERFWNLHDPTTLDRQGPDVGTQYRSAIFFHSPEQEATALRSREQARESFARPIVTEVTPASAFYRAEEYHQRYLEKHGRAACSLGEPVERPRGLFAWR